MKKMMLGLATAVLFAGAAALDAQEDFRLSGSEVAVYNIAGHVELVRGSGGDVVVHVTRGGDDASRLSIEVGQVRGREALRVIYPEDEIVYPAMGRGSSSTFNVRSDGTFGDGGGGRDHRVRVRGSGSGMEAWADIVVEVPAGQDFSVYLVAGESEARGVEGDIRMDSGSGAITARDMSGTLEIDTGSGSVDVTGMEGSLEVDTGSGSVTITGVSGSVEVDTGSGSIEAEELAGDEVILSTGSGRITGDGIRARRLEGDTGSGDIDLRRVASADVLLDTGSGSVDVELLADVESLDVDTGSGSVTVRAPASLGAEVEIETGSGGIDMDFAVQVRSVRRNHVRGTIGDGRGTIRIDTGSGGVRIIRN